MVELIPFAAVCPALAAAGAVVPVMMDFTVAQTPRHMPTIRLLPTGRKAAGRSTAFGKGGSGFSPKAVPEGCKTILDKDGSRH
jgi:hypothetical protein